VQMIHNTVAQEENEIAQMNKQIEQMRKDQGSLATERANAQKAIDQAKAENEACKKEIEKVAKNAADEDEDAEPKAAPCELINLADFPSAADFPSISNEEIQAMEIQRDALVL